MGRALRAIFQVENGVMAALVLVTQHLIVFSLSWTVTRYNVTLPSCRSRAETFMMHTNDLAG